MVCGDMHLRGLCQSRLLSSVLSLCCLSAVALGTPVNVTADALRLSIPFCPGLPCVRGIISISSTAHGSHLGYISNAYHPFPPDQGATQYLLTTSASAALIVNLPSTNIRTDLLYKSFNIIATNPANSKWNYLGAAASLGYEDLRVPPHIALITGTKVIPVGPPRTAPFVQEISDATFVGESQLWFLSCLRQFSSTWVNPDRTTSLPTYFYWPPGIGQQYGILGMTVNIAAVSQRAIPVTFTFEPQC